MRATGIVRRIDELGRVVIPKEIRRTLRIREGDPLEIYTDHDGEVVLKKVKSNLSSVIGRGTKFKSRTTGELEGAIGLSPSKLNRDGNHDIKVGFAEPRSDGSSNAKLANIIEYGKHGQPAKPFLKPAKTASRQECIDAMTKALDEEVEKL